MKKMRVLDLFSGIGGFSLGLERAGGFETVAFCEIEEYPRRVLAKHWPEVPIYHDVRELTAAKLSADGIAVDVICGGFPCQDISVAGKRAGLEGARSGLWREYARLIGELRPLFVIVENVPGLLNLGMGAVLGDLAALGYNATWDCIPASAVGALHRRDRVWIVANTNCGGRTTRDGDMEATRYGNSSAAGGGHVDMGDAKHSGRKRRDEERPRSGAVVSSGWWDFEPDVGRVANGVSSRVDRLRGLGNAVVPQVTELIGKAIMQATSVMTA